MPPPPPQTSQYLTILMTERGGANIFCNILARQCPSPDVTILNNLNDRERGRHYFFVGFWRPPMPLPPQTSQYLTILMTERGGAIIFVGFWRPPMPPPPSPQYLTISMTERGGAAIIFCRILATPLPRRHNIELSGRGGGGAKI